MYQAVKHGDKYQLKTNRLIDKKTLDSQGVPNTGSPLYFINYNDRKWTMVCQF